MGQWTSINSGTSVDLHKIKFADSLNGYILGYHQTQNQRIILKTSDGGHTWNQILNGHIAYDIDFLSQDTVVILGSDTIIKTIDGGINWTFTATTSPLSPGQQIPFFHMNTANDWFFISPSRHTHTTDGGITWIEIYLGSVGAIPIVPTDLQFVNDSTIIGIGWYSSQTYISTDKGDNWSFLGSFNSGNSYVLSVCFPTESIGFAVANTGIVGNYGIFKSTDGGVTWNITDSINGLKKIRYFDENILYSVGDSGFIVKTNNGGSSWNYEVSGTTKNLNNIIIFNNKAIVVGDSGTILMNTNISAVTGLKENIKSSQDVNAFPNPFNSFTTIKFNNPDHKKHLLTIFDLSGKTTRQINNITTEEIMINRGDLPGGAYFFQLENEVEIIGYGKLLIE